MGRLPPVSLLTEPDYLDHRRRGELADNPEDENAVRVL